MKAQLSIPQPCHEDWGKMTATEKGRFCNLCSKEVVDFTGWEPEAILKYLQHKKTGSTCGRLLLSQTRTDITVNEVALRLTHWKANGIQKMAAMIVLLFGLIFSSCNSNPPAVPGTPIPVLVQDSVTCHKDSMNEIMGVVLPQVDPSAPVQKDPKPPAVPPRIRVVKPSPIPEPALTGFIVVSDTSNVHTDSSSAENYGKK